MSSSAVRKSARFALALLFSALPLHAQNATTTSRTILAVDAHAGDAELSMGQMLIHQHLKGDRIVILHMTAGEGGNPKLSPQAYGEQKKREAAQAAGIMGAEIIWAPYADGQIPSDDAARHYVADIIRQVKPAFIITHWRNSIHQDHARTSAIVSDALLLASLEGVQSKYAPWRGVRGLYYAENWEDPEDFKPYIYIDASDARDIWLQAVKSYEFVAGTISSFAYLNYYDALAVVRGAQAHKARAVAFDIDDFGKKRILDALP